MCSICLHFIRGSSCDWWESSIAWDTVESSSQLYSLLDQATCLISCLCTTVDSTSQLRPVMFGLLLRCDSGLLYQGAAGVQKRPSNHMQQLGF